MSSQEGGLPASRLPVRGVRSSDLTAAGQITMLYRVHGLDLVRIAAVMLGSRASAEDLVQDAFCGL
jgi:DNA-directed RNA polymerase specialized sigma24 family protein